MQHQQEICHISKYSSAVGVSVLFLGAVYTLESEDVI